MKPRKRDLVPAGMPSWVFRRITLTTGAPTPGGVPIHIDVEPRRWALYAWGAWRVLTGRPIGDARG